MSREYIWTEIQLKEVLFSVLAHNDRVIWSSGVQVWFGVFRDIQWLLTVLQYILYSRGMTVGSAPGYFLPHGACVSDMCSINSTQLNSNYNLNHISTTHFKNTFVNRCIFGTV